MLLNRTQLLEKQKFEIEKVVIGTDENGEESFVYVRQMSGAEKDTFEQSILKPKYNEKKELIGYDQSMENFRSKLAVVTVCDESGNAILNPEDYHILSKNMTAATLNTIIEVAQRLNAITAKDKEDLVKNLDTGQADASNSNSAEN